MYHLHCAVLCIMIFTDLHNMTLCYALCECPVVIVQYYNSDNFKTILLLWKGQDTVSKSLIYQNLTATNVLVVILRNK